jgi:hypothetical protein
MFTLKNYSNKVMFFKIVHITVMLTLIFVNKINVIFKIHII